MPQYDKADIERRMKGAVDALKSDLQGLRTRALQEGIPYQTLISSVLHKYVSGALTESPK